MTYDERGHRIETMRMLIRAECLRLAEMLDTDEDLTGCYSQRSKINGKMLELRKDTVRLEHLMYCHDSYLGD